ncbi:MAG TPA: hypothetical protein VIT89_03120 [Solirubrobacterales bacterium]
MTGDLPRRIEELLAAAEGPLTTREIATGAGCEREAAEQVVWGSPDRFDWQPGGRWALAASKRSIQGAPPAPDHEDTRDAVLDPPDATELRAIVLGSGSVLRVIRRPLDSTAVFTVNQVGRDLQLVLNSAHEVFADLPMPFDDECGSGDYKRLLELLLAAWAVYEAEVPGGGTMRRELEDARLMWGRTLIKSFLAES